MRGVLAALFWLCSLLPVLAEQVIADLNQNQVAITATFDGSEIFVFGAVRRDAPVPAGAGPLQVLVSIVGPEGPIDVRRKEQVAGIWINTDTVEIDSAPYFYAMATTAPLREVISHTEQMRQRIGLEHLVKLIDAPADVADTPAFREALMRVRSREGLYEELVGAVTLRDETLFDVSVRLPANLVEGDYRARVVLTRDLEVVDSVEQTIAVRRSGFEDWVYTLAMDKPLIYGLLSLAIALFLGWAAASVFRYIRS